LEVVARRLAKSWLAIGSDEREGCKTQNGWLPWFGTSEGKEGEQAKDDGMVMGLGVVVS